ncbi:hypothetical protein [Streptomyces spectabilis]|uniref:hypothetical protein n=1 Tax=Streptomyces spectabilis TaxID=68270 RepID=UPI001CEF70F9|nr:hypothetical protein [Streptomyces spectabilis]
MDANLRAVSQWLAEADPNPGKAWAEWERHGIALLPLGRRFDAIRVPAERIYAAAASDEPGVVATTLRAWLDGPVIRDLRSKMSPYYVLIAPDADWDGPDERLTTGAYLGVPRPGHSTVLSRWVVLPPHPGALCDTRHLRTLLATATPLRTVGG